MRSQFVISCLAFAGLLTPFIAVSATPVMPSGYEFAARAVKFSDLNLSSREDVATLYSRIKSAANVVCEPADPRSVDSSTRLRLCKERAIGQAVADAKSAQLQTFHLSMTNQVGPVSNR